MIRLSANQIQPLHENLISKTGGIYGLRDPGLLDSALNVPFHTFDGQALYPSVQQKAARLCCSLVRNHPFIDGNKQIGVHTMLVFLMLNGIIQQAIGILWRRCHGGPPCAITGHRPTRLSTEVQIFCETDWAKGEIDHERVPPCEHHCTGL